MNLDKQVVVIVGGSSGLGRGVAELLTRRGADVIIVSRNALRGETVAATLGASGYFAADITDESAMQDAFDYALRFGQLRGIVVTAAVGHAERTLGRSGTYESAHELAAFRKVVEANLIGTYNCVRLGAAAMAHSEPDTEGNRGAMVLTSSQASNSGQVGQAAYAASKAGLSGLLVPVARDLAPLGIRINMIRPGGFDTPMYGSAGVSDALRTKLSEHTIFPKRMGYAHEFASLACELLTNTYMNATTVDLDAGTRDLPR